ncbi:MAG: hypothetical protein LBJ63_10510 [Prevotellaceae bacterium]|jgi:hypothetical protein|nr:hypothetical protein [Prevotellaceae bacterium]
MKKFISIFVILCAAISLSAQTQEELDKVRSAANRGDKEAQFMLGTYYLNSGNNTEGVKWISKSAESFAPAQWILGGLYLNGQGVAQDNSEAAKWFRKGAEQNFCLAQFSLGALYYGGIGVAQSNTSALYWCEKARDSYLSATKEEQAGYTQFGFDLAQLENTINELKTPTSKTTSYLSTSTTDVSFSASGGTKTITVSTDGNSYDVTYLPSWCSVSKSNGYFTLVCEGNTGDARTDWFKVKSDEKEVRVNIEQAAGVKTPSAKFENIWVVHNVLENPYNIYSRKGMQIHVKFSVNGMLSKQGQLCVWFYFADGTALKDYNNAYKTSTGQVCAYDSFKATYENSIWNDFVLFMPYDELHLNRGSHNCKFQIGAFDNSNNQIATSEYQSFTFSRTF